LRADVALAWRLLRYANSAAIGLAVPADSVERAVQVLGRGELVRWLSVQLLAAAEARQVSQALQISALARGRLLETLARASGRADPASAFTLGLLSYGEPLLQMTLAEAIAPLRLGADVNAALLQRRGPLADWLLLAEAVDSGAAEVVQEVGSRLGVDQVIGAHTEAAWEWAVALSGLEK
jgi:EAL and modified HD-GYP domain-containing signal transduction protein